MTKVPVVEETGSFIYNKMLNKLLEFTIKTHSHT